MNKADIPTTSSASHKELRKALIDLDLSVRDVADRAGCTPTFVIFVSKGKRMPGSPMARRVLFVIKTVIEQRRLPSVDEIPVAAV